MTKESKYNIDHPRLIFSETFADEQSVRRNGGIPSGDVSFNNGVATFDGVNDWIDIPNKPINIPWTVRAIIKPASLGVYHQIIGAGSQVAPMYWQAAGGTYGSFLLKDGAFNRTLILTAPLSTTEFNDVVITADGIWLDLYIDGNWVDDATYYGIIPQQTISRIGARTDGAVDYDGDIELIEIYNYALTQSEIANMAGI